MGALAVCPFVLMAEKYMCMVVWERRRRDLEGRAVRSGGVVVSWDPLLGATGGGVMLLRSCACQMSQCSAVQSMSERMAWGRGVGGGP